MKYTQTRLPKSWGKPAKTRGYLRKELFPRSIRRLIKEFAFKQPKIPELLWDEFERQGEKCEKCVGCNCRTDMFLCWTCFKYGVKDGNGNRVPETITPEEFRNLPKPVTNPNKYEYAIFEEVKRRWPAVPESWWSLRNFLWVKRYTGCKTGFL